MRSIIPLAAAVMLPGAPSLASSGRSILSRTRTSALEPDTLTPAQASSGISSSRWFFTASASQAGQKEPSATPAEASARRTSPSVTLSQPLMSISQTKSEPAASSAKHTTAAVSSAMRRRSLCARSAPPRELILASSHWLRAAIAAAAE